MTPRPGRAHVLAGETLNAPNEYLGMVLTTVQKPAAMMMKHVRFFVCSGSAARILVLLRTIYYEYVLRSS